MSGEAPQGQVKEICPQLLVWESNIQSLLNNYFTVFNIIASILLQKIVHYASNYTYTVQ